MHTHCSCGGKRRLALITLYASLCSVFALQLAMSAVGWTSLGASVTNVSALPGDRNLTIEHLRSYQAPSVARAKSRAKARTDQLMHAAPTVRKPQARTGR